MKNTESQSVSIVPSSTMKVMAEQSKDLDKTYPLTRKEKNMKKENGIILYEPKEDYFLLINAEEEKRKREKRYYPVYSCDNEENEDVFDRFYYSTSEELLSHAKDVFTNLRKVYKDLDYDFEYICEY